MPNFCAPKPKAQESLAQGLRWVNFLLEAALKGGCYEIAPAPQERAEN
jgi:hypothetical protein